jgi:hypothetical protein
MNQCVEATEFPHSGVDQMFAIGRIADIAALWDDGATLAARKF